MSHRCFGQRFLASRQDRRLSTRPCRPVQPLHSKSDCAGKTGKTDTRKGGKECWECYETRTPCWYYSLNWMLTVQTCCLEPMLNTRAQVCSEAFWRPHESHLMTSWCLGSSLHCPVLLVKGQKSILLWNAVKRSRRQAAVKTCDDVHDWQGVSDKDFDGADNGESTTIPQASGRGSLLRFGRSPAIPAWQTALKWDCASLQPTVWEYFVTLL